MLHPLFHVIYCNHCLINMAVFIWVVKFINQVKILIHETVFIINVYAQHFWSLKTWFQQINRGSLVLKTFENLCQDIWSYTHGGNGQVKVCEHAISETLILNYHLRIYNFSSGNIFHSCSCGLQCAPCIICILDCVNSIRHDNLCSFMFLDSLFSLQEWRSGQKGNVGQGTWHTILKFFLTPICQEIYNYSKAAGDYQINIFITWQPHFICLTSTTEWWYTAPNLQFHALTHLYLIT
jgi:hypothetical protein